MSTTLLTVAAVVLVCAALTLWFRWMNEVSLRGRRWIPLSMVGVGGLLSLAALAQGGGIALGVVSGLTLAVSAGFLFLAALAPQSKQTPALAVGGPILDFTAVDENDQEFRLSDLSGKPILLKFFRGHW